MRNKCVHPAKHHVFVVEGVACDLCGEKLSISRQESIEGVSKPDKLPIGSQYRVVIAGMGTTLTVDAEGILRLPTNKLCAWICDNIKSQTEDPRHGGLNAMAIAFHRGQFTLDEYRKFYLNIGYSISGLLTLSFFEDVEVSFPPELEGYI